MDSSEPLTFDKVRLFARRYDLVISRFIDYKMRPTWRIFRIVNQRAILVKWQYEDTSPQGLQKLRNAVIKLSRTVDYEQSKCA